ncbi:hypothetical protein NE237_032696 [Protea cynaroides]|uniref:Uncharacterized protein n=1 Tax=Protea cynaroides TaxID=273540 RepID=A0A9Q0L3V3_9MAGN|nr:hypothetical protein NE237_032696 [Protea cynaroides]
MSVCKVVYHYENRSQPKVLDSDLYSYIDVIYDIYNSVLRHIPEEKSISFKVKCVMEDIDVEMEIDSDGKVQKMFQVNQQGSEFHLHVYDVNVFYEYPNAINGYSKTIMDRKGRFNMMGVNVDQNFGKRRIQKTLARRFVSEPRTISEPRDKEAHVHEVQVVPVSEPRVVEAVETVEESCGNQSSTDDAEWTDSGEEDWEDTSTEEDSEEANVEEGKATSNDEEEIHWSSDEFEGLESDDEREVEKEKGFMLEKGKARKQKAPVSTSQMATRSQNTNASTVETMQENKTRKMKEYLAKRRARMARAAGVGGDAIGASSTSVTGGDAGAVGAGGDGGDGGAGTDFFEHLINL